MMDTALYRDLMAETCKLFPKMRDCIVAYFGDPCFPDHLSECFEHAQVIRGAASMAGRKDVETAVKGLQFDLENIVSLNVTLTEDEVRVLLDRLANIEKDLSETSFPEGQEKTGKPSAGEIEELVVPNAAEVETLTEQDAEGQEADDFEIDPEMLEVFAMEAEDLLRSIGANLELLERDLGNREALMEIRRNAHTLKGAAGIVGLKAISGLAHRVEDLLDHLAENNIENSVAVLEILIAATECLEALSSNDRSNEIDQRIDEIRSQISTVMGEEGVSPAKADQSDPVEVPAAAPEAGSDVPAIPLDQDQGSAAEASQSPQQKRTTLRVSIERLDELSKLVSEMVISRSVFESRLHEMEQHLSELHHSTDRLKLSTGRLETEFEPVRQGYLSEPDQSSNSSDKANPYFERLFEEFDALELDRYTDFHQTTRELVETSTDATAITAGLDKLLASVTNIFENQKRMTEELQESLLRLRMVPLNSLSARLHRTVRVTAFEEGKLAELEIENENIEIDTQIFDAFVEPIVHLLRNAVAHGIEMPTERRSAGKPERGCIRLKAYSEGTNIVFVVSDDGRGIELDSIKKKALSMGLVGVADVQSMTEAELVDLIFAPGLSTAKQVNQVSGRGVGMDIVRSSITRRGGTVAVTSKQGQGTTFTIKLPMSLAVTRVLFVRSSGHSFAFPLKLVKGAFEADRAEFEEALSQHKFEWQGKTMIPADLSSLLGLHAAGSNGSEKINLLRVEVNGYVFALKVDEVLRPEEVVLKPVGGLLKDMSELLGATILGDGSIVPVLDLGQVVVRGGSRSKALTMSVGGQGKTKLSVLVVDDSPSVRQINSKLISKAGWDPITARDGQDAIEQLQNMADLPDIILTDVEMPRMDGYELVAALKTSERLKAIPVIMITSRNTEKHRRKAFDLGVSYYLPKPYEEAVLRNKILELAPKE